METSETIKLNDHTEWHGAYKGIAFEIVKWKREVPAEFDMGYTWNFYIWVKPRKIRISPASKGKEKLFPAHIDYSKMYRDVEMHGGITYWARMKSYDKHESDKIGCDYAHSWDCEDNFFGKFKENKVEWVLREVKECIDNLPSDLKVESK